MAELVLAPRPEFPVDTTVGLYPRRATMDEFTGPAAAAIETATVAADRTVTFTDAVEGANYYAAGEVDGVWHWTACGVKASDRPFATEDYVTEHTGVEGDSPLAPLYLGNATESEYADEPDIPIQVKTYHGNAGGYAVDGRPQGIQIASKYFAETEEDSMQCGSGIVIAVSGVTAQTEPLAGWEGGAVIQGDSDVASMFGLIGSVDAQDTAHADLAAGLYIPEKSASEAGASISFKAGVYVETPLIVGTVTDNAGIYSKPRIQTESTLVVGTTQANTTAAIKGTTVHIVGNNTTGNPAFHIVKKSGSNDDIAQFSSSGAQPQVRVNGSGQVAIHAAGGAISYGSAAGAMLALGNITTPPSANYSGGSGGFLYVESGALKFRGGGGLVTTIAASA